MRTRLEHTKSDFRGGVLSSNREARHDITKDALLGDERSPVRAFTAGASIEQQKRSSNDINSDYSATVTSLTATLKF